MKIHEYQGKAILAPYGVPIPRGEMTTSAAEAGAIARKLGGAVSVVKAQIHAGGRGKGGGVKVVKSPEEAEKVAAQILGMQLVTHQTGPAGQKVGRILVEEGLQIARELYFGMLDRSRHAAPGAHGQLRRRHGHRGSGGEDAAPHPQGVRRPRRSG